MGMLDKVKKNKVIANFTNLRYLIYGLPKVGKTSLVYNIVKEKFNGDVSNLLLIAFEDGFRALDGIEAVGIESWEDFLELIDELVDKRGEVNYKMLALDTMDIASSLASTYVLKKLSRQDGKRYQKPTDVPYGGFYVTLENEVSEAIQKLDKAGFNLIFLTHDKDKTFTTREGQEYNKTTLSLTGRVRDVILNIVDIVAYIDIIKEKDGDNMVDKRIIRFRGDSSIESGSRFAEIPEFIEYNAKGFIDAVEGAMLSEYGGDKKALDMAKKEQEEEKEVKAQEFVNQSKVSVDDLKEQINKNISSLDKDTKIRLAKEFKIIGGTPDYNKFEDIELLQKVLQLVGDVVK